MSQPAISNAQNPSNNLQPTASDRVGWHPRFDTPEDSLGSLYQPYLCLAAVLIVSAIALTLTKVARRNGIAIWLGGLGAMALPGSSIIAGPESIDGLAEGMALGMLLLLALVWSVSCVIGLAIFSVPVKAPVGWYVRVWVSEGEADNLAHHTVVYIAGYPNPPEAEAAVRRARQRSGERMEVIKGEITPGVGPQPNPREVQILKGAV